jgi:hypothetical protein
MIQRYSLLYFHPRNRNADYNCATLRQPGGALTNCHYKYGSLKAANGRHEHRVADNSLCPYVLHLDLVTIRSYIEITLCSFGGFMPRDHSFVPSISSHLLQFITVYQTLNLCNVK